MSAGRRPAVGVTFRPQWPAEALPGFAADVERLGFDELWVVEDCFFGGGMTLAAIALGATSSVRVGIGLLPAAVRNPAIAAMELAGLARVYPGRLSVAFGHGVEDWMRQIDARPRDRVAVLAETVQAVRDLLAGMTVSMSGDLVSLTEVALDHPPPRPPEILVGSTGRRGLEIAGRVAQGILLPQGATPAAVRWTRGITRELDPTSRTVVYAWLSIGDDIARARVALLPELERWLRIARYPELIRHVPPAREEDSALAGGKLDEMAIVGDPAACASEVRRWAQAGADSVVLRPPIMDGVAQVQRFAAEVLPALG